MPSRLSEFIRTLLGPEPDIHLGDDTHAVDDEEEDTDW